MAVGSAFTLCSCNDFLDREEDSFIDKTATFDSYNRTNNTLRMLIHYSQKGWIASSGDALLGAATDDACFAIESSNIQQFNNGSWNALSNPDNVWDRYFAGIAKCCTLLENSNHINLDISRLDPVKNGWNMRIIWRIYVCGVLRHTSSVPTSISNYWNVTDDSYHQIDIGYQ